MTWDFDFIKINFPKSFFVILYKIYFEGAESKVLNFGKFI